MASPRKSGVFADAVSSGPGCCIKWAGMPGKGGYGAEVLEGGLHYLGQVLGGVGGPLAEGDAEGGQASLGGEGGCGVGDATGAQGGGQAGGPAGQFDQLTLAEFGGGGDDRLATLDQ